MNLPTGWRTRLAAALLGVGVGATGAAGCTFWMGPSALEGGARTVDPAALAAPACREVDPGDLSDRDHLDPATAPPASELYDTDLPAAGPHFGAWSPVVAGLPDAPMDPRALLHNMEHGAVVVWLDPDVLDAGTLEFAARWRDQLGEAGFDNEETGAAVFVSRVPDRADRAGDVEQGEDRAGVALRAWGVALDCEGWDLAVADAFVGLHYGTRGEAPEAELGPWPAGNGVLIGPPGDDDEATTTV